MANKYITEIFNRLDAHRCHYTIQNDVFQMSFIDQLNQRLRQIFSTNWLSYSYESKLHFLANTVLLVRQLPNSELDKGFE